MAIRRCARGIPLPGALHVQALPEEDLTPVGQLAVHPLDLAEALDEGLIARPLGILAIGRTGFGALPRLVEDAHQIVGLIAGPDRAVTQRYGFLLPSSRYGNALGLGRFVLGQLELQEPIPIRSLHLPRIHQGG